MSPEGTTSRLLAKAADGEGQAREQACGELLGRAAERLGRLARHMHQDSPAARRWTEPEDLVQDLQRRLLVALRSVSFQSSQHFWTTATQHLRFALIDLARHHGGPQSEGAHHHTDPGGRAADDDGQPLLREQNMADDSDSLEEWARFHEAVGALPEHQRVLFDLLHYQGLTQEEASEALGLPLRTLKSHWQKAREELGRRLRGG
jgi:RNA polymerase sigma factor (sigma-70 family)